MCDPNLVYQIKKLFTSVSFIISALIIEFFASEKVDKLMCSSLLEIQ